MTSFVDSSATPPSAARRAGLPEGAAPGRGLTDGGWIQLFEKGAMVDSASTTTQLVWGSGGRCGSDSGRENGPLGYPVAESSRPAEGWIQRFQKGCIVDSTTTPRPSCATPLAGLGRAARDRAARLPHGRPRRRWPAAPPALPARRAVGPGLPRRCSRSGARCSTPGIAAGGAGGSYGYPAPRTWSTTATARSPASSRAARSPPERAPGDLQSVPVGVGARSRSGRRAAGQVGGSSARRSPGHGARRVRVPSAWRTVTGSRVEAFEHRDGDPPAGAQRPGGVAGREPRRQAPPAGRPPARRCRRAGSGRRAARAARPAPPRRARPRVTGASSSAGAGSSGCSSSHASRASNGAGCRARAARVRTRRPRRRSAGRPRPGGAGARGAASAAARRTASPRRVNGGGWASSTVGAGQHLVRGGVAQHDPVAGDERQGARPVVEA